jgi:hypothetical protein
VFACALGQVRADFHTLPELTDADVGSLVHRIRNGVLRQLRKLGKLPAADGATDECENGDPDLLRVLQAAAVQGRTALGGLPGWRAGACDTRQGQRGPQMQFRHGAKSLCADLDGFSLHGATCVAAGRRDRLEHLIRYVMRPPIADERLRRLPDGRVACALKKRWQDGTASVVLDPLTFLERLAALVPRPRKKLVNYYGVFASAASYRHRVVPERPADGSADLAERGCTHGAAAREPRDRVRVVDAATATAIDAAAPGLHDATASERVEQRLRRRRARRAALGAAAAPHRKPHARRRCYLWAELQQRVFLNDVLACVCGGRRRLLTWKPRLLHLCPDASGFGITLPMPRCGRSS